MSEHSVLLQPPFFWSNHFFPRQMIDDLIVVAGIDEVILRDLAAQLANEPGVLTEERLKEVVASHIADERSASAAATTIRNLPSESVSVVLGGVENWRRIDPKNAERISDEVFQHLKQKLPLLVSTYPSLNRMRKSQQLRGALGNSFREVQMICDVRPVFDESRAKIESLAVLTTLKLSFDRQNQDDDVLEVVLTSSDLDELIEKAGIAKKKLEVLSASLGQWCAVQG